MATPRICCVDKTKYEFCPHCNKVSFDEMWKTTFCSENCRDIYKLATSYTHNKISSVDAKAKLDTLDISNINNFADSIKAVVYELNATSTPTPVVEEVSVEPTMVEEITSESDAPIVEEPVVVEEAPRIRRRGKNNIVNED